MSERKKCSYCGQPAVTRHKPTGDYLCGECAEKHIWKRGVDMLLDIRKTVEKNTGVKCT